VRSGVLIDADVLLDIATDDPAGKSVEVAISPAERRRLT